MRGAIMRRQTAVREKAYQRQRPGQAMASTLNPSCDPRDIHGVERANVLLLLRLIIRKLLEEAMRSDDRAIASDHPQLQNLFVVLERALRHGLKRFRSIVWNDYDLWQIIEKVSVRSADLNESVVCIQQLPHVVSQTCRFRAWLRLSLMQKKLADYVACLVEAKDILRECFEGWALVRQESAAAILTGNLVGLRVIECNLFVKEDELKEQPVAVDISSLVNVNFEPIAEEGTASSGKLSDEQLKSILDQANYLEERNAFLELKNKELQMKVSGLATSRNAPVSAEYVKEELNDNKPTDDTLTCRIRELETALDLTEKDVHLKQDTIIALRQQVSDIQKVNADLYTKLRRNSELRDFCEELLTKVSDYERALEEVGIHLSESKLKVENLKEDILPFTDAQWVDDKEAIECKSCSQKFSVSRRKHHCRSCGGIFCNGCSANTLPLPSSAKPVRVCDTCLTLLLRRLTIKTVPSTAGSVE
ncbi:unnamed protein product [Soboliphyme baturini]|uniref:FYVE-type domain-containing protein n=1 Tax=Soboliphyme baturini TaxID=241478 RepID=A0A183IDP1_9BILA|nr:unnamed protein product [Soboliphyme baturini]